MPQPQHRSRVKAEVALLSLLLTALPLPSLATTPALLTPIADLRASSSQPINLRKTLDPASPVVTWLRQGESVLVTGESGEFVQVRTAAGQRGFVKRKYLAFATPAPAAPQPAADIALAAPAPLPAPAAPPAAASVTSMPAAALKDSRWYARIDLGWLRPDKDALETGNRLRSEGYPVFVNNINDESPQLGLNFGYRLLPNLSLEAGLLHLDDVDFSLVIDDPAHPLIPSLRQRLEHAVPATATGLTAAAVAHWSYAGWRFSARGGYFAGLDKHVNIRVDGQTVRLKSRDRESALLGAGVEYALSPRWHLGIDYQALDLVDDLRAYSLTLAYHP